MQTKFNYVSSGLFTTLTGGEYSGYLHVIDNNVAFSEKFPSDISEQLIPVSKFAADLYISEFNRDRVIDDTLTLPHQLEDIVIEPNEIVNFFTLNTKINYLFENILYTYSKLFLGSTAVPVNLTHTYGVTAKTLNTGEQTVGDLQWIVNAPTTQPSFISIANTPSLSGGYPEFDKMKKFIVIPYDDKTGYGILGISDTHLIGIEVNNDFTSTSVVLYTDLIDNNTDERTRYLADISFDNNKYAFITDKTVNQVYKYDVQGFFNNDTSIEFKRYLVETIGGLGSANQTSKFNAPTVIGASPTNVLVYNSNTNIIKVYNSDFIFQKNITLSIKPEYVVKDIGYRKINNHFYILVNDEILMKTYFQEYDESFTKINEWEFEDTEYLLDDESLFVSFSFAEQDSNVLYALTNSRVFKKFISKPNKTVATFSTNNFSGSVYPIWNLQGTDWTITEFTWNFSSQFLTNTVLTDIIVLPLLTNDEDVFVLANSRIFHFCEKTVYDTVLADVNISYYNLENIKFNKDEYVQYTTFNKEFFKLYKNTLILKDLLIGRFSGTYDYTNISRDTGYRYITNDEFNNISLQTDLDAFINANELVQSGVVNQILTGIYQIQSNLIKLANVHTTNAINTPIDSIE